MPEHEHSSHEHHEPHPPEAHEQMSDEHHEGHEHAAHAHHEHGENAAPAEGIAIDPVCHMEVEIATARYISEHAGQKYYFCNADCKRSFEKEPAKYLAQP